jgi:hypothetical protein
VDPGRQKAWPPLAWLVRLFCKIVAFPPARQNDGTFTGWPQGSETNGDSMGERVSTCFCLFIGLVGSCADGGLRRHGAAAMPPLMRAASLPVVQSPVVRCCATAGHELRVKLTRWPAAPPPYWFVGQTMLVSWPSSVGWPSIPCLESLGSGNLHRAG